MKPSDFINLEIKQIVQEEKRAKWQVRPMCGWPDGIDPYPLAQDDDIVLRAVYGTDYELKAEVPGIMFKFGDKFLLHIEDNQPIQFTVAETGYFGFGGNARQKILAIGQSRALDLITR